MLGGVVTAGAMVGIRESEGTEDKGRRRGALTFKIPQLDLGTPAQEKGKREQH